MTLPHAIVAATAIVAAIAASAYLLTPYRLQSDGTHVWRLNMMSGELVHCWADCERMPVVPWPAPSAPKR